MKRRYSEFVKPNSDLVHYRSRESLPFIIEPTVNLNYVNFKRSSVQKRNVESSLDDRQELFIGSIGWTQVNHKIRHRTIELTRPRVFIQYRPVGTDQLSRCIGTAANDLLCDSTSDDSAVFDVLTKYDAHTIDIG